MSGAHGFLRARDGIFTTIDPPGSFVTSPTSTNTAGAITGYYFDAIGIHGFVFKKEWELMTVKA